MMKTVLDRENIYIGKLVLGPFKTNAYILICRETGKSLVVDAPADAQTILKALEKTMPRLLVLTHSHMDHIQALGDLKTALGVPVACHREDAGTLPIHPDFFLKDEDSITLGSVQIRVLHTPGHTPGSTCFLAGEVLFSGDTVFPGGPGHTESEEKFEQIFHSLITKILPLPDTTLILPGHGDSTVLGMERPLIEAFSKRSGFQGIFGDVVWA